MFLAAYQERPTLSTIFVNKDTIVVATSTIFLKGALFNSGYDLDEYLTRPKLAIL